MSGYSIMKNILTVVIILGLSLCAEAVCDLYSCTLASAGCDNYDSYLSCLQSETDGCGSSQSAERVELQTMIDRTVIAKNSIGCGEGESCYSGACVAAFETEQTCTGMYTYISCLQSEMEKCTNTSEQITERKIIQEVIDSNTVVINAKGCGDRSRCNIGDCTLAHGSTSDCAALNSYFDCLHSEVFTCTVGHTFERNLIQTAIDASYSVRDYYKCDGTRIALPLLSLMMPLHAVLLKP